MRRETWHLVEFMKWENEINFDSVGGSRMMVGGSLWTFRCRVTEKYLNKLRIKKSKEYEKRPCLVQVNGRLILRKVKELRSVLESPLRIFLTLKHAAMSKNEFLIRIKLVMGYWMEMYAFYIWLLLSNPIIAYNLSFAFLHALLRRGWN